MILDKLVLDNFGLFRGKHEITLSPPTPKKRIVLIGGLNGRGKTTILDAIQLALYGKFAQCSNRGGQGYRQFLRRSIHRGESSAAVEVHFRGRIDGEESSFAIRRRWTSAETTSEHVRTWRNGVLDPLLRDNWNSHIEQFLPVGIASLFFFDGEKIEQLADPESSRDVLSSAVHALLGVDLLEQLMIDLKTLERRKRQESAGDHEVAGVEALESTIHQLAVRIDEGEQDLRDARTALERERQLAEDADAQYKRQGGVLYQRRVEIESQARAGQLALNQAVDRLIELSADATPLLLIRELLKSIQEQSELEVASASNQLIQSLLEDRDEATLAFVESAGAGNDGAFTELLCNYLQEDRSKRNVSAVADTFLSLSPEAKRFVNGFLNGEDDRIGAEVRALVQAERRAREEAARLADRLDSVPPEEAIAALAIGREEARVQERAAGARVEEIQRELGTMRNQLEDAAKARRALLEKDISQRFSQEDSRRTLKHSRQTRLVLEKFKNELVKQSLAKIASVVLYSFQELLGKRRLVQDLRIDPDTLDVELLDEEGNVLSPQRLSAGERQLLAVALLWGLARASGRALPTVIDTPLGRLDSSHRTNLVERYFPSASHQVVLLSTDEEINRIYHPKLAPSIGRSYLLQYDDDENRTTVVDGYFW